MDREPVVQHTVRVADMHPIPAGQKCGSGSPG